MTLVWHNTLFSIGSVVGAGELSGNVEYQGFGCECLSAVLCCFCGGNGGVPENCQLVWEF